MDKDLNNKKIQLMNGLLKNPKLYRTFKDAMSAPIGSTKREQAKSILSIMKKTGGIKNDGMGGPNPLLGGSMNSPLGLGSNISMNPNPTPTTPVPNYSNLFIFPAAPKPKIKDLGINLPPVNNVKDMKFDSKLGSFVSPTNNSFTGIKPLPEINSNTKNFLKDFKLPPPQKQIRDPFTGKMTWVPDTEKIAAQFKAEREKVNPPASSAGANTALTPGQFGDAPPIQTPTVQQGPEKPAPTYEEPVNTPAPTYSILSKIFPGLSSTSKPLNIVGRQTNATLDSFGKALVTQESGGNYSAVNPDSGALGKYQIMPFNLGFAGLKNTPEDIQKFLASPALQDKAFGAMMADLSTKYNGDIVKIAAAYYGGDGGASKVGTAAGNVKQGKYPSINEYVEQVLSKMPELAVGDISSTTNSSSSGLTTYGDAQSYIDNNMGAYAFGDDLAKSYFGGKSLDEVIIDSEAKLKKDFNLESLEKELTVLKSQKENLIPTLNEYMKGKDQYLSFIDKMIDSTRMSLLDQDMGDPHVAARYNNYMDYLTTLKSRQTNRYGTYLNSAITDYNAEVTRVQDNYNNVKADFNDALTRQATIDQNTYNNLMARGSAYYTELENAPTKLYNKEVLTDQYNKLITERLGIGTGGNPDIDKDIGEILNKIALKEGEFKGTLDINSFGPRGLIEIYEINEHKRSDQKAAQEAIRVTLARTLALNGSPEKVAQVKKLITQLKELNSNKRDRKDDKTKDIISNIERLASLIKDLESELLSGDTSKELLDRLYSHIEGIALGIRPEEIAIARKQGKLNEIIKEPKN